MNDDVEDVTADLAKRMRELSTKPRLWRRLGFWRCARADSPRIYVGLTPADAYQAMREGGRPLS